MNTNATVNQTNGAMKWSNLSIESTNGTSINTLQKKKHTSTHTSLTKKNQQIKKINNTWASNLLIKKFLSLDWERWRWRMGRKIMHTNGGKKHMVLGTVEWNKEKPGFRDCGLEMKSDLEIEGWEVKRRSESLREANIALLPESSYFPFLFSPFLLFSFPLSFPCRKMNPHEREREREWGEREEKPAVFEIWISNDIITSKRGKCIYDLVVSWKGAIQVASFHWST